ncbi:hypothetical protein [Hyalangium gracile]|uniref:hypothetical protein n=1 Tax=Hyalangium gracile TaxID=394092 RepID=UPI001CCA3307|nr:hypothetical protein [Hyalangium gracile]
MKTTYGLPLIPLRLWLLPLLLCCACANAPEPAQSPEAPPPQQSQDVRGARYCEVLLAYQEGLGLRVDVYNTYLLNDCPEEAWQRLDSKQLQQEFQASAVILNGPRYWMIDAFTHSAFLDTESKSFGGIEMRKAGQLRIPLSEGLRMGSPYATRTVARNTTYVFQPGKPVHELVDPEGRIFVMQSFSVQLGHLSQDALADLGSRLSPPQGWTYRTRQLSQQLLVTAIDGVATIVQDELGNTYQLSQQQG